jgi:hypothetical protein
MRNVLFGLAILALPALAEELESPLWWVEQAREAAEAASKESGGQGGLRNVAESFALLGECEKAEAAFAAMPEKDKRSAHYALVEAMVMGGHPDRAEALLEMSTGAKVDRLKQTLAAALARRHALAGEVDAARELMAKVESPIARRQIWYALVEGQVEAGEQARALALSAETPMLQGQLLGHLARLQVSRKAPDEARKTIAQYAALAGVKPLTLVRLHLEAGNVDAAMTAFKKMKAGRPKTQYAATVAEALAEAGRFDDAVELAQEVGMKKGGRKILARTACAQARAGRQEDALETLSLTGLEPGSQYGHMDVAEGLALGGNVEEARKVVAAFEKAEWGYKTWSIAADAALKAGDLEAARALGDIAEASRSKAAASETAKSSFLSIYDMTLARLWAALGEAEKAEAALQRIEDPRWLRSTPRWMVLDACEHGHLSVAHRFCSLVETQSRAAVMCRVAELLR